MTKTLNSPTLAETAFGLKSENPLARMMAGFTGFAVAITLILATAIPVQASRTQASHRQASPTPDTQATTVCALALEGPPAPCLAQ